jgi:predicted MPP superfamily phosphohydrolase
LAENGKSDYIRKDSFFVLRAKIQKRASLMSVKLGLRQFNPDDFKITHLCVKIPNLAAPFENYRIIHISDIHFGQWMFSERLAGVVELINGLEPDAVAITGDFVSYFIDESTLQMTYYLSKLKPRDVSVAVLGNHDHWAGAAAVREILAGSNVFDISNDVYVVHRGGALLSFVGVDSDTQKRDRLDVVLGKMPVGPSILLVHEPDFAVKSSATDRFSLQLSGHSHGGQFVIPGFGTPIRGSGYKKYPLGEYKVGNMLLYVNRGLGTNSYWVRINCPPEIAVITLEKA